MNNLPSILYVEDEDSDILLLRLAFERAGLHNPINTVADGTLAIDYLAGYGPFADRRAHPFPSLVLLDLNLPRKSGFEVLEWSRAQPHLKSLPIVVFTSSDCPCDRKRVSELGANDYVLKRSDVDEIAALAQKLVQQWLTPENPPQNEPRSA